ncbi:hypothetical protein AAF712_003875 [Marasmius tenuissimus]|uniref:Uncharacterized protein n=1 Tax=Marasmius tenuissimus TaxID=585030 RepID=A0ABR3A748_9AGAR
MSGLAPTLIIVRIAYGKSVDSVQQQMLSIHFAEPGSNQGANPSALRATVDIRSHRQNEDLEARVEIANSEKMNETRSV